MKNILIVMGPPGSGKGTQAAMLKDKYGITHISTYRMRAEAVSPIWPVGPCMLAGVRYDI